MFSGKETATLLANQLTRVCSCKMTGIDKNQAEITTGTPMYPPKDSTMSGFSRAKIHNDCINPIGIFSSEGIVYIVNERCSLHVIMGINFTPNLGKTSDSTEQVLSPSLVNFLPIYRILLLGSFNNSLITA